MANGVGEILEYGIYAASLLLFIISSLLLGLNPVFIALAVLSFAIAAFIRSNALALAALFSYAAAIGLAPIGLTLGNILLFGLFSLAPFFACFRIAGSKVRGTVPFEAASVLLPVGVAAFLFVFNIGPIGSSEQALTPQWLFAASLLLLLALLLAVPLLGALWGLLAAASRKPI